MSGSVFTQDKQTEDSQPDKETTVTDSNKEETTTVDDLPPELFNPTDELSEDKDVAFPTNI